MLHLMLLQVPDTISVPLLMIAILLIVLAVLVTLFVVIVQVHKALLKSGRHPALLAFAHEAIVLAYKASDTVFDQVDDRLHGVQKKELADAVYDLLPDTISVSYINWKICWKDYVSKEQFSQVVQSQYTVLVQRFGVVKADILQKMLLEITEGEAVKK